MLWVPRRTLVSHKILEDEGVLGDVAVSELPLTFLPLENDILSLEIEDAFSSLYYSKDPTPIFLASKALMAIQRRHGFFPRILGKGDNARKLAGLLLRARKELEAEEEANLTASMPSNTLDSLIIIDRDVDFATPLLTQLTYEGLIDEFTGIQHNHAEVNATIVGSAPGGAQQSGPTSKQSLKRKVLLDSSDTLYTQLRSANFAIVGSMLNKMARRLESDYDVRHKAQTTSELKDFVAKLPGYQQEHQSLRTHINMTEDMTKHTRSETFGRVLGVQQSMCAGTDPTYEHETIEELISRDVPLQTILRLLCLESTVSGGLRPRDLDNFKRQILHAYGFQHLLTLDALEKMELLQSRGSSTALLLPVANTGGTTSSSGSKTNYNYLRKILRLNMEEVDEQDPTDVAYVYSGYAPLSIRLIQCILQKQYLQSLYKSPLPLTPSSTGWTGFEDILKSAKGPTFNIQQKPHGAEAEQATKARAALTGGGVLKTVYVMFLGGITFTEIAALKFVAKKLELERKKIVICTTGIINGRKIMESVMPKESLGSVLDADRPGSKDRRGSR